MNYYINTNMEAKNPHNMKLIISDLYNEKPLSGIGVTGMGMTRVFLVAIQIIIKAKKTPKLARKNLSGSVELYFIKDAKIRQINNKYRHINKPTDVISLSYLEKNDFPGENLLGEIFISLDTAKRQAQENGNTLKEEILFLFIHGLLHVFGYDHENKTKKEEMFGLHEKISSALKELH